MGKAVAFSCLHAPYEDRRAFALILKVIDYLKPDTLINLGDFLDCYQISAHERNPRRMDRLSFADEVKHGHKLRAALDETKVPDKRAIIGNHEARLERYIRNKAPELAEYVPTIEKGLGFTKNGWKVTQYRQFDKLGKLALTHDLGFCGVYAGKQTLDAASCSILFGHTHRLEYRIDGTARGKKRVGMSVGWLGDPRKTNYEYRMRANRFWSLGFAVIFTDDRTGLARVIPIPIINYACTLGGQTGKIIKG